jgi:glycosyltransferase 2 family protein
MKMWRTAIKAAISVTLIGILLRQQNLSALGHQIAMINEWSLLFAALILCVLTVTLVFRWTAVLKALGVPTGLRTTFPLVIIGQFFSQVLPSGVGGDIARTWLARNSGMQLSVAVSSIAVDRLSGLLALFILVTAALPISEKYLSANLLSGTVLLLVTGYFGFLAIFFVDRLPRALDRFKVAQTVRQIGIDVRATLLGSRTGIIILAYSLANQIGCVFMVFVLSKGLDMTVDFSACLFVVPLANLLQTLPLSIAGWGVRESFLVTTFGLFGGSSGPSLALSIIFGFLSLVVSLPGGMVWLLYNRKKINS